MAKKKFIFVCKECGYDTAKWQGQCPGCGEWNSFEETAIKPAASSRQSGITGQTVGPQPLDRIVSQDVSRLVLDNGELDGVLGGGIVPGSLILVGGEPGIGKSTLLMQIAYTVGMKYGKTLYVSGEESAYQIKMRAERLGAISPKVLLLTETDINQVVHYAGQIKPVLLILDSIQTVYHPEMASAPASVSQIRQCTAEIMKFAKLNNTAAMLVGHVTKEGVLAGPRVLEHMVDTVLYFEGERHHSFRLLRTVKNRFGSTNEIAVFDMQHQGLIPFADPSKLFLEQRPYGVSGSVVTSAIQGTRPVLLEVQALTSSSTFGNPRRLASGVDFNRTLIILAVLEKIVGIHISGQDVYVNITGGVRVDDPGVDLAVAVAVVSSFRNLAIDQNTVIMGEVGLGGEVRAVGNTERRIKEAKKLGFSQVIVPKANLTGCQVPGVSVIGVSNLNEALDVIIGR